MGAFILAGFTSTAAVFQCLAVGAVLVATGYMRRRPIAWRRLWGPGVGALVAGYYALYAGQWSYAGEAQWQDLLRFLWSQKWPILAALALLEISNRRRDDAWAETSLVVLTWFVMAPVIFFVTREHGFFFSDRQYIYWTASTIFVACGLLEAAAADYRETHRLTVCTLLGVGLAMLSIKRLNLVSTIMRLSGNE
jgi:hypothetical protein